MALLYWVFSPFSTLDSYGEKNPPAPVIIPLLNHEYARKCTDKHSDIGHRRRSDEERRGERSGLTWKNAQPAVGLPNPCRGGSLVLRVQCVNWQTQECEDYSLAAWRGRHSVDTWCGYSSLSLSLLSSSSKRCSESTGALPSERRERASIHDQSCVKNKLQPVLDTYSYFFSFSFFLPAQIALLYAPPLRC